MKDSLVTLILTILFGGLFVLINPFTIVRADVGYPVSITATYNSSTGQLNASGTYAWEECEPGEETNVLGYALFVNNGTPANSNSDALDGSGMHLANGGNGCTTTPDNWSDSHTLSSAPSKVCVVVYDVRADDSADPEGIHSTIGAGGNYNTDNSWDANGDAYSEASCTVPATVSDPNPTPTPTSSGSSNNSNGGSGGSGSAQCTDSKPGVPTLLSVVKNTPTTAILTWTLVPSATDYSIVYGQSAGNYIYGVPSTGNTNNFTIGSLNTNVNYHFAVRAVNGCTPGDLSNDRSAGTSSGQVLGASTMGDTGLADHVVMSVILVIGALIAVKSGYAYAKAK